MYFEARSGISPWAAGRLGGGGYGVCIWMVLAGVQEPARHTTLGS